MSTPKFSRFSSNDPKDIAWRVEQMHVDNAIEGVERDPALAAFVAELNAAGLSPEEKIKRVIEFDLNAKHDATK